MSNMKNLSKKFQLIKLVITDVDGVLTDGGMYYSSNGDVMKKFFARDGMGVTLLRKNSIPTIIITKEKTIMVKKWAKKMNISKLFDGVTAKEILLQKIMDIYNIKPKNIAFIGDDVNDIALMHEVGLSACPQDAAIQVQDIVDYRCIAFGGKGAFRELCDQILRAKFPKIRNFY